MKVLGDLAANAFAPAASTTPRPAVTQRLGVSCNLSSAKCKNIPDQPQLQHRALGSFIAGCRGQPHVIHSRGIACTAATGFKLQQEQALSSPVANSREHQHDHSQNTLLVLDSLTADQGQGQGQGQGQQEGIWEVDGQEAAGQEAAGSHHSVAQENEQGAGLGQQGVVYQGEGLGQQAEWMGQQGLGLEQQGVGLGQQGVGLGQQDAGQCNVGLAQQDAAQDGAWLGQQGANFSEDYWKELYLKLRPSIRPYHQKAAMFLYNRLQKCGLTDFSKYQCCLVLVYALKDLTPQQLPQLGRNGDVERRYQAHISRCLTFLQLHLGLTPAASLQLVLEVPLYLAHPPERLQAFCEVLMHAGNQKATLHDLLRNQACVAIYAQEDPCRVVLDRIDQIQALGLGKKAMQTLFQEQPQLFVIDYWLVQRRMQFFYDLGATAAEVNNLFGGNSSLLFLDTDTTVVPLVNLLRDLGMTSRQVLELFLDVPKLLQPKTNSKLKQLIRTLRQWAYTDAEVLGLLTLLPQLFCGNIENGLKVLYFLSTSCGMKQEAILKLTQKNSQLLLNYSVEHGMAPTWNYLLAYGLEQKQLQDMVRRFYFFRRSQNVETTLTERLMFYECATGTRQNVQGMLHRLPTLLALAVKTNMGPKLLFWQLWMAERQDGSGYYPGDLLSTYPQYFSYSITSRIIPRVFYLLATNQLRRLQHPSSFFSPNDKAFDLLYSLTQNEYLRFLESSREVFLSVNQSLVQEFPKIWKEYMARHSCRYQQLMETVTNRSWVGSQEITDYDVEPIPDVK